MVFFYEKNASVISDTIMEYHISGDNIIFWSGYIYTWSMSISSFMQQIFFFEEVAYLSS